MAAPSPIDSDPILSSNGFGFRLLSLLSDEHPDQNISISPLGVSLALTMTYNGARGKTKQEMAEALGFDNLSLSGINEGNASLLHSLTKADPEVRLQIANAIWAIKGEKFNTDFLKP